MIIVGIADIPEVVRDMDGSMEKMGMTRLMLLKPALHMS